MKEVIFKLPDEVLALIVHKVANTPQEASLLEKWIYDGEERKTGRWIRRHSKMWECSECERGCKWRENYCPDCGAKMEVDE